MEQGGVSIPLKYLPSRGKMFLDPIYDTPTSHAREIIVDHGELSSTVEEPRHLGRITVKEMQRILGGPSELCVQNTLKNTTRLYNNQGDRVTGVLYPRSHMKKRLTKLAVWRIRGTVCTDTVFAKPVTSVRGYNCFQLFWNKVSKYLYAVPLKTEKHNYEALEEFIAQVGVPEYIHFDNAKSQVSKAWKRIFRR